jgi:hypothetical protein
MTVTDFIILLLPSLNTNTDHVTCQSTSMWGASRVAQCQLLPDVLTSAVNRKCGKRFVDILKEIIH